MTSSEGPPPVPFVWHKRQVLSQIEKLRLHKNAAGNPDIQAEITQIEDRVKGAQESAELSVIEAGLSEIEKRLDTIP